MNRFYNKSFTFRATHFEQWQGGFCTANGPISTFIRAEVTNQKISFSLEGTDENDCKNEVRNYIRVRSESHALYEINLFSYGTITIFLVFSIISILALNIFSMDFNFSRWEVPTFVTIEISGSHKLDKYLI